MTTQLVPKCRWPESLKTHWHRLITHRFEDVECKAEPSGNIYCSWPECKCEPKK